MIALLRDAARGVSARRGAMGVVAGGLMLALSACLLVTLLAHAFADVDPTIPGPDRVVLLDFKGNIPGQPTAWLTRSPVAFATLLKERNVPLDLISRYSVNGLDIETSGRVQPAALMLTDPDLVPLFGLKPLHGDLQATLRLRNGVAINRTLVRMLWGPLPPAQALGKQVLAKQNDRGGQFYTVTAILPDADPRSPLWDANPIVAGALAMAGYDSQANPMPEGYRNAMYMANGRVFARLRPGVGVERVGEWMRSAFVANPQYAALPAEWKDRREAAFFRGVTLTQLPFEGAANVLRWRILQVVAAACALLLLLAAFNAMNLQTANLLQRQRETALRRSLGAGHWQLLRLWVVEGSFSLLIAACGAVLITWWVAPVVANWVGLSPDQPLADPLPAQIVLGLTATIALLLPLTLAMPAWIALRRRPAPALQGRTASEGPLGRRVRQGLLTLQLGGAMLLLTLACVLTLQQQHLLHADRGFATHNRIWLGMMVNPERMPNLDAFTAALSTDPAIEHWAFSDGRPARDTQGRIELNVGRARHKAVLRVSRVSPGFFATYGMTILAGVPQAGTGEEQVVIDANAARLLGFGSPQAAVGSLIRGGRGYLQEGDIPRRVTAVVKSVKLESAREPAMPQAFVVSDEPRWDLTVYGRDRVALRRALERAWKTHGPARPYEIGTADEQLAQVYRQEGQLTTTLIAVALLSIAVAVVGAYALIADTLRRRRTELVLRRLHGASSTDIAREVLAELVTPLLAAAAIGLPIAYWLGERYLSGFVDRVATSSGLVWPLFGAAIATTGITAVAAVRHLRLALAIRAAEVLR